jgi:competence protein ComEA
VLFAQRAGERGESGDPGTGPPGEVRGIRRADAEKPAVADAGVMYARLTEARLTEARVADAGVADAGVADGRAADEADTWGAEGGAADEVRSGAVAAGAWRARARLALRERMPVWLQARCGLERRSVVALTVVLVVAAGFAVQHFWAGRAQSVRAPEVVRAADAYGSREAGLKPGLAASLGAGAGAASATPGPEIVVDVSGKVREPGIHRLPAGSRVVDALRAAGGVRPGTDTDGLNRARFLVDGEQVVVGGPAAAAAGPAAGGSAAGGAAGTVGAAPATPVSLNTATVEQLETLPGVGPVLAQHIIDYRTRHGGFRSVDELREVNGIGDRRFADLRNLVRP